MGRSIRLCQCGAPAAYGPWCIPCCREQDPQHMAVVPPWWEDTPTVEQTAPHTNNGTPTPQHDPAPQDEDTPPLAA